MQYILSRKGTLTAFLLILALLATGCVAPPAPAAESGSDSAAEESDAAAESSEDSDGEEGDGEEAVLFFSPVEISSSLKTQPVILPPLRPSLPKV